MTAFVGSVQIENSSGGGDRITLDGDAPGVTIRDDNGQDTLLLEGNTGRIFIGGSGHNGHVQLHNAGGQGTMALDGDGNIYAGGLGQAGAATLRDVHGRTTLLLQGTDATLFAGGNGHEGHVQLRNAAGQGTMALDGDGNIYAGGQGQAGTATLRDVHGRTTLLLQGADAKLFAGGGGHDGHIQLRTDHGDGVISLNANGSIYAGASGRPGSLTLNTAEGKPTVALSGEKGDVYIGGPGQGGTLRVRSDTGKERILIDGNNAYVDVGGAGEPGDVVLRNSQGNHSVRLNGGTQFATVAVGCVGQAGRVRITDNQQKATIVLDGQAGDIFLTNADCAEEFELADVNEVEPGTVMVLDGGDRLRASRSPYDRKVAGIVSGAGSYRPGVVLDKRPERRRAVTVALMGKVYCKVDATYGAIEVGDLLTSSPTPGHAMKATDPARAFGAVIGKALHPLPVATGLIPVLVSLQ